MHSRSSSTLPTILLLCAFITIAARAQERFVQTNGPHGGNLFASAAANDGTIYVVTRNFDAYRSSDDGRTWRKLASNANDSLAQWLEEVAVDSAGRLYVAGDHGVWHSTTRGESWEGFSSVVTREHGVIWQIKDIQVNAQGIVFAIYWRRDLADTILVRSTDGGRSFTPIEIDGAEGRFESIMVTPASTALVTTLDGVYRSTDNGGTWSRVDFTPPAGDTVRFLDSRRGSLWMLANASRGLYHSTDDGVSWGLVEVQGLPIAPSITAMTTTDAGTTIVTVRNNGLYRSTDAGVSWTRSADATDLLVAPPTGTVIAGAVTPFRSTDDGITWRPSIDGLITTVVHKLVESPDRALYAGTADRLFRSTNGGEVWDTLGSGVPTGRTRALTFDAAGVLWAAVERRGLHRSTDRGATWSAVGTGLVTSFIYDLVFAEQGRAYAATDSGMHVSTDGGTSWSRTESQAARGVMLSVTVARDGSVIAGSRSDGILRSIDHGVTWSPSVDGITHRQFPALATTRRGTVLAAAVGGFYRSIDSGRTWQPVGRYPLASDVRGWAEDSLGVLWAGTHEPARSTDNGLSWHYWLDVEFANNALTPSVLAHSDGDLYIGTQGAGVGRMVRDRGERWRRIPIEGATATAAFGASGVHTRIATDRGIQELVRPQVPRRWELDGEQIEGNPRINAFAADEDSEIFYAAAATGLYRSERFGAWVKVEGDLPAGEIGAVAVEPMAGVTLAGSQGGIQLSFNQGASWGPASSGPTTRVTSILVTGHPRGYLLAAAQGSGVWRSEDRGATWAPSSSGLPSSDVTALALAADGSIYASTGSGIYRTIDHGSAWTALAGLAGGTVSALAVNPNGILFAGTGTGVHRSSDGGATFTRVNTEYSGPVTSLGVMADGSVVATTPEQGAWQSSPDGAVASIPRQTKRASESLVLAVDGNPLRSSSLVRFATASRGRTRLELVDMSGRAIAVLLDRELEPGEQVVPIDRDGLTAGACLLRLSQTDDAVSLPLFIE